MRDCDPKREQKFFEIFANYYDAEKTCVRSKYDGGTYSLERMQPLAEIVEFPEKSLRVIHVAGTKGKTSTCHMISALVTSTGRKCGMFTSPHLATVRERFQIDNRLVSYETLLETSRSLEKQIRARKLSPSLFEIMTVLALTVFRKENCEFAVMETGIGGLLDSTNYIPHPECSVITPVSFDHTGLLGSTIEEIATQKAGIIKPEIPVVSAAQPFSGAEKTIKKQARKMNAPVLDPVRPEKLNDWSRVAKHPAFFQENFRTALQACRAAKICPDPGHFSLPSIRGRCEVIRTTPLVILDGAHNENSAKKLTKAVTRMFPGEEFTVILGIVKNKDARGILNALLQLSDDFILTNPRSPKGSMLPELTEYIKPIHVKSRILPEISNAEQLPKNKNLLFTGSFYTALIGEIIFNTHR